MSVDIPTTYATKIDAEPHWERLSGSFASFEFTPISHHLAQRNQRVTAPFLTISVPLDRHNTVVLPTFLQSPLHSP